MTWTQLTIYVVITGSTQFRLLLLYPGYRPVFFFFFFLKAFSPLYLISDLGAFEHGIINRHRYM